MQKTWFITGASRGLGVQLAKAALQAGNRVVAAGRKRSAVIDSLGPDNEQLLSVALDVTDADQARAAIDGAIARFGAIDVLVNNAGYGHLGFFEETSMEDAQAQFATNVFGVFNVTRAALPSMRSARNGRIFNISSVAGFRGTEFGSLYCASKFALEGFSESLASEVAPFGLFVTIIEPGPFRTDFLSRESLRFSDRVLADYGERHAHLRASFEQRNGQQPGDPAKLAAAMVRLASEPQPPMRFVAGTFGVNAAEAKLSSMRAELESWRPMSVRTDYGA
jgi:NAD(P)-dependent dehydrogenase (short-subunit alcohol dehydrogenase family)